MNDDNQEMRLVFLAEMGELVQDIEADLLQLEDAPSSRGLVDRLFRSLHTIKGGAGMTGMELLSHYTHAVENMLDEVRKGHLAMSSALVSLLLEALDCLKGLMAEALGEGTLDGHVVEESRRKIMAAMGKGRMPEPVVTTLVEPLRDEPLRSGSALYTFIIQVHAQPDFIPLPSELDARVAALSAMGQLVIVSHDHSLPPEGKRDLEHFYLWRSFHLVTEADEASVQAAMAGWLEQHRIDVIHITMLPEAPLDQAEIDAAVDGSTHDVLGESERPTPALVSPTASLPEAEATYTALPLAGADKAGIHSIQKLASIRVDLSKLDKLVNLVGELVTTEARLDSFQTSLQTHDTELAEALLSVLDDNSRTLRELQDQAMTIRMVPIGSAFDPLQRLIRDYCHDVGKRVRLTIVGHETEVDKKIAEQISGPLKHLIRNSLDHGIELPDEREAKGKLPEGTISLSAYHQAGLIVIEVRDDGRGIDIERVIQTARQKNIIDGSKELTEREALELIFAPALSTAQTLTEVSGRGVGMDVVKRDIEALRGSVDIATQPGYSTTITVRIPLTLSIADGLLVGIGESTYIIPLSTVEECVELLPGTIAEDSSNFLDIRGELIPFLRLRSLFAIAGQPPPVEKVVIVSTGDRRIGLVVDQLLGDHQTVINPLSRLHRDVQSFSGATILGDGSVVLILDVLRLIEFGRSREERLRAS
jgi:two-component system chemotaxis sensor kinase CheA